MTNRRKKPVDKTLFVQHIFNILYPKHLLGVTCQLSICRSCCQHTELCLTKATYIQDGTLVSLMSSFMKCLEELLPSTWTFSAMTNLPSIMNSPRYFPMICWLSPCTDSIQCLTASPWTSRDIYVNLSTGLLGRID